MSHTQPPSPIKAEAVQTPVKARDKLPLQKNIPKLMGKSTTLEYVDFKSLPHIRSVLCPGTLYLPTAMGHARYRRGNKEKQKRYLHIHTPDVILTELMV